MRVLINVEEYFKQIKSKVFHMTSCATRCLGGSRVLAAPPIRLFHTHAALGASCSSRFPTPLFPPASSHPRMAVRRFSRHRNSGMPFVTGIGTGIVLTICGLVSVSKLCSLNESRKRRKELNSQAISRKDDSLP